MGRNWKIYIIAGTSALFGGLIIFMMFHFVPSPPISEMAQARKALSGAMKDRADSYSEEEFGKAVALYDSAMICWKKENDRFIYSRDYSKVAKYAELSEATAISSSENSRTNCARLKTETDKKIKTLGDLVTDLTERFNDYPLAAEVRNSISRGKFLLTESGIAFQNGDYLLAGNKINESENLLTSSYEHANENLKSYFRSYPEWKRWVDSTIAISMAIRDYSIIIDKFSRKVLVYLNGAKQFEYSAELGKNWVGDKRVRGDKATPEGMYKIIRKFKSDSTKYYKALLLDYPNDEDTASFLAEKARGYLPGSAKIGGMIEIHGNGGKGIDWTEGCIALTDREMDSIFKIVRIGTPVTIVGSMYNLRHVQKR
jgi:lipoprotein-anchoring transpeptidase ErfK/SrfK